jgi:adenine deaminase
LLLGWPGMIGLGEMMYFPGVINGNIQMLAEMATTMNAGKTIGAIARRLIRDCVFRIKGI